MVKRDLIGRCVGDWGRFQFRAVFLIFLTKIPASWFMACLIFTAPIPKPGEFYCKSPTHHNKTDWIKVLYSEFQHNQFKLKGDVCNVINEDSFYNQTSEYDLTIPKTSIDTIPCEKFEHNSDYMSIITNFDLVCSKEILVAVTQSFHLFGVLCGGILATILLEYFSPKKVMLIGMVSQIITGLLTGYVSIYGLHVFFRCTVAACTALMYTPGAVIFSDITAGKYKTIVSTMFEQFWSIGVMLLPAVAGLLTNYTYMYAAISLPTVFLVVLLKLIPDSPRWLLARGRIKEVEIILKEVAKMNKTTKDLPSDLELQLNEILKKTSDNLPKPQPSWWSLWKGFRAKRYFICVHLCWAIYLIGYYGMLLNIRGFGREYLHTNTAIAGLCELLGTFFGLYLILETSRKWLFTGLFNIVMAFCAFCIWFIPNSIVGVPRVVLLMITSMCMKIGISTTLSILTTCTAELVSAEKKKLFAFSAVVWGRIWFVTAPLIGATTIFGPFVPQTAFGCLTLIGGVLSIFITSPRTVPKNKKQESNLQKTIGFNVSHKVKLKLWTVTRSLMPSI